MGDMLVALIALVAISALLGKNMAKRKGYSPITGALIGGILPLVGLGAILLMNQRKQGDDNE